MLLAASLGLQACTTDNDELLTDISEGYVNELTRVGDFAMEFKSKVDTGKKLSKVQLSDGWDLVNGSGHSDVWFFSNELTNVFNLEGNKATFSVVAHNDDLTEVVFGGEIKETDGYYALCPAQGKASISGNVISASLPDEQLAKRFNFSETSSLCVSYSTDEDKAFIFKPVVSSISFGTGANSYAKAILESLDGTAIAGDFTVAVSQTGAAPTISGGTSSKVVLYGGLEYWTVYMINILPVKTKGSTLKLSLENYDGDVVYEKIINNAIDFQPGINYNLGVLGIKNILVYPYGTDGISNNYECYEGDEFRLPYVWLNASDDGRVWGWATDPSGESFIGMPGQSIVVEKNLTLYPCLVESKTHKVTIHGNSGYYFRYDTYEFLEDIEIECKYGAPINLPDGQWLLDHFAFNGYYETSECVGNSISTLTVDDDVDLYVGWEFVYNIEYYDSDGTLRDTDVYRPWAEGFYVIDMSWYEKDGKFAIGVTDNFGNFHTFREWCNFGDYPGLNDGDIRLELVMGDYYKERDFRSTYWNNYVQPGYNVSHSYEKGGVVVNNLEETRNFWDLQYVILSEINVTSGKRYKVTATINAEHSGELHLALGNWSQQSYGLIDFEGGVGTYECYIDYNSDDDMAFLLFQSGDYVGEYVVEYVKIEVAD